MSFNEVYKYSLERLDSFINEKYDWDGHGGRPLAAVTAGHIDTFLRHCYSENISEPSLAMCNDGSVAILWTHKTIQCYVVFSNNRNGYIFVITSSEEKTLFNGFNPDYLVAGELLKYLQTYYPRKPVSRMLPYKAGHDLTVKDEYDFNVFVNKEFLKRNYTDQKSKDAEGKLKLMRLTEDVNKKFAPTNPVTPERIAEDFFAQEVVNDCKNDHGERTNKKLKDQPFYHRNRTGKLKKY